MFYLDSAVGVEIRGNSLVFAAVSKGFQGYLLRSYGRVENYKDLPPSDLYAWVQQFVQDNGLNRENVILGLPRDQVVIRQMELPLEVEENLDQVVRFQLEKFEPADEGQSYCDYVVLEKNVEEQKILIQTMMVPRPFLDQCLSLFSELNLYPAAIRISSVGLFHLFSVHEDRYPEKNPYLILDIDLEGVEFVLVRGRDKFFSEKVLLSQDHLTFQTVLQEIDRFFSQLDLAEERLAKIYLSGSLADQCIDDFRDRFQDCELLSKRLNLNQQSSVKSKMNGGVGAIGLAISGMSKFLPARFNLIPTEKRVMAERPSVVPTLVLAGLLIIMGLFVSTREYFQQRGLLAQVEAQIATLQTPVDQTMALKNQIDDRRAELEELQNLIRGHRKVLLVLKELTERIPDGSFLQNVNVQGDRVSITGFSDSASTLLKILLDSEYLGAVESRYITPDRTMKDREKFSFEARVKE